nr:MAG TPA: Endodeoxyribonuclease RusA [Caudoviricetes sp.]
MNTITFRVHGTPATQGSKRHVGRGVMVEMNKKLPAWRKAIIAAGTQVAPKQPLDCPVSVETTIWVPRPKKPRFDVPATPGDLDKYLRALGDGIEQAGILKNDARITHWHATKHYADARNPAGAHITITWKD